MHWKHACLSTLMGVAAMAASAAPSAAATVTFVAPTGNDANNCLGVATACRQFTRALTQTNPGGTIIAAAGDYDTFTINKSVDIVAENGSAFIGNQGGGDTRFPDLYFGILVDAAAGAKVSIRGMTIGQHNMFGFVAIIFAGGASLLLDNVKFGGAGGPAIYIAPLAAAAGGVPTEFIMRNSISGGNDNGAVLIAPRNGVAVSATFDNVMLHKSTYGIRADNAASGRIRVDVKNSVSKGHSANGYIAVGNGANPVHFMIDRSTAETNAAYGAVATGAQAFMIVSDSTLIGNGTGLAQLSGSIVATPGNNVINFNTTNTAGTITPISLR